MFLAANFHLLFLGSIAGAEVVFTGAEPPRIVEGWSEWNGVENTNCFADAAADWEFPTWQGEGADCAWVDAVVWEPGTAGTEAPVPYAWLDGFGLAEGIGYEEAALADADGDGHPAWAEYVAGTDPTDDASVLTALISVRDGAPSVTWEPDLGSARVYTVEGKASLTGDWQSPANATHRFFRVKVSMGSP